jgi:hypothetical protein
MLSSIKVNFEIVEVNIDRGVAYVKYWADDATAFRFHADIGPYEIPISPEVINLSQQELINYIAKFGYWIVKKQKDAIDAEVNGSASVLSSMINQQGNTTVELE